MLPDILHRLGLAALEQGDEREALARFDDAVEADPGNTQHHRRRAQLLRRIGRLDEAEADYRALLARQPEAVDVHRELAGLLQERGRLVQAEPHHRAVLKSRPDAIETHNNLGNLLKDLGRLAEAESHYRTALAIDRDFAEGHCNLGNLLTETGRRAEAEACFREAIRLRPTLPEAYNNLGNLLRDLCRPEEAATACQEAIRLRPNYPSAYSNLANALRDLDRGEEAEAAYRNALRLAPGFSTAHSNLATVLLESGRLEEAISEYRAAVTLDPDYADAHNNLGIALLLDGAFEEGWWETEWRWRLRKNADVVRRFTQPRWNGEPTDGKVLLLYAEQGLGDTVQFCRYVPLIAARNRVVLEVQRPLLPLLCNLPGVDKVVAQGDPLPAFDLRCPLLSLPGILGTTLETIPAAASYLEPDAGGAGKWRDRLAALPGLKVGIVWAGNPAMAADRYRSTALAQLAPLAAVPGVSLISLQKGDPAKEAVEPPAGLILYDWTAELENFADTAALISELDLVIGVDTAVIHVAGALGKPTWLLNRFDGCWRWLRDRSDSPWYPTLRQFRQTRRGDWSCVIPEVVAALRERAAAHDPGTPIDFDLALQHHRAGRWQEAERLYRTLLAREPNHADSCHLLGVLSLQRGQPAAALELIRNALALKPGEGVYLGNLGLALKSLGRPAEAEDAMRRALSLKPDQADVLNNLANLLCEDGRTAEAETLYHDAIRHSPRLAVSYAGLGALLARTARPVEAVETYRILATLVPHDLGPRRKLAGVLLALGRKEEAATEYRSMIEANPNDAALHVDHANLLKEMCRTAEAEAEYRRALSIRPGMPAALINLSNLVNELGRKVEAEQLCRDALRISPTSAEAHNNLGLILKETGRPADAEACYREAIRLRSSFPEPLNNLGDLLREQERLPESEECCRSAIRLRPNYASAYNNLGNTLWMSSRLDDAEAAYREALRLKPDFPSAFSNLGTVLIEQDRHAEAETVLRQALELDPLFADAHCNIGVALVELQQIDQAVHHYEEAIRIKPSYAEAYSNLGSVMQNRGELTGAIAAFREAIRHKPNYPDGHNNLAIALLLDGQLSEGWREYEWRWRLKKQLKHVRPFAQPMWAGEATGDEVLLLHAEQGLGDTLQFCRYAPLVAARGHRVVLEVQRPLVRLLAGLPGVEAVIAHGDPLPQFTRHCPLLGVPGVIGTVLDTIPAAAQYLSADPAAVEQWRGRLSSLPGKKVGLVWGGNPAMSADRKRSIEFLQLAPLAAVGDVSFVSLQKGGPAAQAANPPSGLSLHDWMSECPDFAATAALIETLDLVIGVDTSVIHLAAALGKPVWLLNRFDCCWRWLQYGEYSAWYPTLRQFRQQRPGAWSEAIGKVATALVEWAGAQPINSAPLQSDWAARRVADAPTS